MKKNNNSFKANVLLSLGMLMSGVGVIGGLNIILTFFGGPMIWPTLFRPIIGYHAHGWDLFSALIFTPTMALTVWACFYFLFISKSKI